MNYRICAIVTVFGLALSSMAAADPPRFDSFRKEVNKVVKDIRAIMREQTQNTITIGQFAASHHPKYGTSTGPGFEDVLLAALEAEHKGIVKENSELFLQGSYALMPDTHPDYKGSVVLKLVVKVMNSTGDQLGDFSYILRGIADLVTYAPPPAGKLPTTANYVNRNKAYQQAFDKSGVVVRGVEVLATAQSLYGVEIRAKGVQAQSAAQPRTPRLTNGKPEVDVAHGEVYEVVIHNHSAYEIAVGLSIDGLDAFTFSEIRNQTTYQPSYRYYIVGANGNFVIPGWHLRDKQPNNYSAFLVTEFGKGASTKAARPTQGKTGVIAVTFSKSLPKGSRSVGGETGFGPPRSVEIQPLERVVDVISEVVTIRYTR